MLELEDAQQRIIASLTPLAPEIVPLHQARHRWLAREIVAAVSLPGFDNSAMDGYALRAGDAAGASQNAPAILQCVDSVPAGAAAAQSVRPGTCIRVFTGSVLPPGADAVVMQEDTRRDGEKVHVLEAVKPWEHVRLAGEDVKAGTVVARAGERIAAVRLAVLAATGVANVAVSRPPVVGILGTGNELVEAGRPLAAGQVYESNRAAIAALVADAGGVPRIFPLLRDSLAPTRTALAAAFAECDCVVTTGGVSVGEHDVVKAAFAALGGSLEFWRVAVKPGKPFVFGRQDGKLFFGLPGNPVSAFVTFLLRARPALLRMQGAAEIHLPGHPGVLAEPVQNRGDRRHFMRVRVDREGGVRSAGLQASHSLGSLARADGLLSVPPHTLWPEGHPVQILRWEMAG